LIRFVSDHGTEPWFAKDNADLFEVPVEVVKPVNEHGMKSLVDVDGSIGRFQESSDGRVAAIGSLNPEQVRSYDQDDLLLASGPWPAHAVRNVTAGYDFDIGGSIIADQHPPRGGGNVGITWSADGRSILTVSARHGASQIVRIGLDDGRVEPLTDESHEVIAGTCTPDGRIWAITMGSVSSPVDLYRLDVETRHLTKLFGPNDKLLASVRLGAVEKFTYPSFDGRTIDAWVVKPPDFTAGKKYPMVLEIHGGPHTAYGVSFFHEFQILAGAGYVVLYTNPRGSTTYGQEFGNIIQFRYPGDDARDLEAGVDALIARGYVDPKRLGVTGGSGGGLLTNWLIGKTHRYAAAVTDRCVADWASFYYSADFTLFTPTWFRKPPYEDPDDYRQRSPVTYAASITTPLMVVDGEEDWRTPIGQGEAMFRALKQQKKTAVMVRFPGENHELSRSGAPSRRVQRLQHIRKWFDKFLLGKPIHDYDG
jgi:dipeptidyl aminopeptidase/acylaminoacyl peptidase